MQSGDFNVLTLISQYFLITIYLIKTRIDLRLRQNVELRLVSETSKDAYTRNVYFTFVSAECSEYDLHFTDYRVVKVV